MIKFENLVKKFGDRTILKGISFEVEKGDILFILGTSGTGKSVLLKNIVGLLTPTSGNIWIDGEEVSQYTEEQYLPIRKKCGMVFQHPALFDSLSIFENVAFGLRRHYKLNEDEITKRVKECLSLVNLNDIESKLPQEISYGMQKRVSLARTVAVGPQVLLFDEPTTGLDPVTTNVVNHLILDLSRKLNTTSVVVSHDMHCALEIADKILVLDKGQIVEQGTPEEIRNSQVELVVGFMQEVENHV
ncbi:MAG: ABC transporter ATP-binding protein [Bdellovibrionaceae bacterium]|nr:ABC transporter ATP-binding protein [Pseudobdellovibrionaceae bacterium]